MRVFEAHVVQLTTSGGRALRELRQVIGQSGVAEALQEPRVLVRKRTLEIRAREVCGGHGGIRRDRTLAQHERAVAVPLDRPDLAVGPHVVHHLHGVSLEPRLLDDARDADRRFGLFAAPAGLDVDREEKLAIADAALGTDDRAVAAGEQHARRSGFTAPGHAVRVPREQRAPQRLLVQALPYALTLGVRPWSDPGERCDARPWSTMVCRRAVHGPLRARRCRTCGGRSPFVPVRRSHDVVGG